MACSFFLYLIVRFHSEIADFKRERKETYWNYSKHTFSTNRRVYVSYIKLHELSSECVAREFSLKISFLHRNGPFFWFAWYKYFSSAFLPNSLQPGAFLLRLATVLITIFKHFSKFSFSSLRATRLFIRFFLVSYTRVIHATQGNSCFFFVVVEIRIKCYIVYSY